MQRIESQVPEQMDLARKTLSYVTFAKRPLTCMELRHALAAEMNKTELNSNIPHINDVVTACAGLINTIGGEQGRVRLIHETAHEYLRQTQARWLPKGEKRLATACIAYLSQQDFEAGCYDSDTELKERQKIFPFYGYAAVFWGRHARAAMVQPEDVRTIDLGFLESTPHVESACQALFTANRYTARENYSRLFPRHMSGLHLAAYFGITSLVDALLLGLNGRSEGEGTAINAKDGYGRTALA